MNRRKFIVSVPLSALTIHSTVAGKVWKRLIEKLSVQEEQYWKSKTRHAVYAASYVEQALPCRLTWIAWGRMVLLMVKMLCCAVEDGRLAMLGESLHWQMLARRQKLFCGRQETNNSNIKLLLTIASVCRDKAPRMLREYLSFHKRTANLEWCSYMLPPS